MDPQVRNFKDFVSLYNKITHLCFSHCVDNFYSREISKEESDCVDKCLHKFTRVNQRIMNVYVEVQTAINTRRMVELEALQQQKEQAQLATSVLTERENKENLTQLTTIPTTLTQTPTASEIETAR